MTEKTYNLTLTEKQATVLTRALDLFSRIGIGQFEEVINIFRDEHLSDPEMTPERIDEARKHIDHVKFMLTGHPANGSFGILNPRVSDDYRIAYDIQQVIRNRLAWDRRPEGGIQVQFDPPDQTSKTHPLATIKEP